MVQQAFEVHPRLWPCHVRSETTECVCRLQHQLLCVSTLYSCRSNSHNQTASLFAAPAASVSRTAAPSCRDAPTPDAHDMRARQLSLPYPVLMKHVPLLSWKWQPYSRSECHANRATRRLLQASSNLGPPTHVSEQVTALDVQQG